jgi:hypothetical protein
VIESTFSSTVHTQALSLCAELELLLIFGKYCIIISNSCIFTAIDNNFDFFLILSVMMVMVARSLLLS